MPIIYLYCMKWCLIPIIVFFVGCGKEKISLTALREIQMPVQEDISAVWFSDESNGLACGGTAWKSGFILSTQDGGETWNTDTILNRKMEHISSSPNGQAYACGQDFMLFRSPGEERWQILRQDFQWLRCAHFPADNFGAVVSGEGYHSGQLRVFGPDQFWQHDTLHEVAGELEAVWYANPSVILAVGTGWVIRSDDAGKSWERLHLTGDFYTSVHFPSEQTGYICGNTGDILKTTDAGKNWVTLRKGGTSGKRNKCFKAIWFTDDLNGWLVGNNGIFWHTNDGAESWQQVEAVPSNADFTDVFVLNGKGWATAAGGRLFVFEK